MLKRAIALSLALLIGIGVIIPLATQDAEARSHKHHKHHKHYKKYSRQWWRQYHARMRRRHALQARKRALRLNQLRLAREHALQNGTVAVNPTAKAPKSGKETQATSLPSGDPAP